MRACPGRSGGRAAVAKLPWLPLLLCTMRRGQPAGCPPSSNQPLRGSVHGLLDGLAGVAGLGHGRQNHLSDSDRRASQGPGVVTASGTCRARSPTGAKPGGGQGRVSSADACSRNDDDQSVRHAGRVICQALLLDKLSLCRVLAAN